MPIDIRESMIRRAAYRKRIESLGEAGKQGELFLCAKYIDHWINHWVLTFDPRESGVLPFDLFSKQLEFLAWLQEREALQEGGVVEKSRDQGATWLSCAYATHGLLFRPGFTAGSRRRPPEAFLRRGTDHVPHPPAAGGESPYGQKSQPINN
jgi:phage terminase large subunit